MAQRLLLLTLPVLIIAYLLTSSDNLMLSTLIRRMSTQTSSASFQSRALSRPLLNELHDWWLQGVPTSHDQPVGMEIFKRWFTSDAELDGLCRCAFVQD
jgi:dipeptide/tripeptide permease